MEGRLRANMLWDSIVRYKTERGALGSKTGYPRLHRGPNRESTGSRGNMGIQGGWSKTNLVKALLETRGCRWISYSNSKQYS